MSNVRVLCKGLVIHEPSEPAEINAVPSRNAEPGQEEAIRNRELLLDKAGAEIARQYNNCAHIDTKTGIILGFALVSMAQLVLAVSRIAPDQLALFKVHAPLLYTLVSLVVLALAATVWATSFGLLALEPRKLQAPSVQCELKAPDRPTKELLSSCIEGIASGIDWNDEILQTKLKQSRYAAYGVGVSLVCYVAIAAVIMLMLVLQH